MEQIFFPSLSLRTSSDESLKFSERWERLAATRNAKEPPRKNQQQEAAEGCRFIFTF